MTDAAATAVQQSPPGRGGIAVILLSGPQTDRVLAAAFRPRRSHRRGGRDVLQLGHVVDGRGEIDEAVVARRGGAAEINIHGGPAAARATLRRLEELGAKVRAAPAAATDSFPTAHPAMDNPAIGREMLEAMPLARGQAVAAALACQWCGGISRLARDTLAATAPDRNTASPNVTEPRRKSRRDAAADVSDNGGALDLSAALRRAAGRLPIMLRLLHPAEVVLAGPPNAGKSTLANALVGREISLVHETPGTTRDWVREPALLRGLPVWLTDTAGLWQPPDGVDAEAVRRARERIGRADVVVLLGPGRASDEPPWLRPRDGGKRRLLRVASKCDTCAAWPGADAAVSAVTGDGLDDLAGAILRALGVGDFDPAAAAAFTRRQAGLLAAAAEAMERADAPRAADHLLRLLQQAAPAARQPTGRG